MKSFAFLISLFISSYAFAVDPYSIPESFPKISGLALTGNSTQGCSASVIAFEGYRSFDQAYILTNGHCSGKGALYGSYLSPDEFVMHTHAEETSIWVYGNAGSSVYQVVPSALVYATMTGKDMAFYELYQTYDELKTAGITPLMIAKTPNVKNGETYYVHSSYWKETLSCEVENNNVQELREGLWRWNQAYRLKPEHCQFRGGISGAPLTDSTNRIVGIVNTTYENGEACSLMNPCEVDSRGNITTHANAGYAMDISNLYTCVDSNGRLNMYTPGCAYPRNMDLVGEKDYKR